MSTRRRALAAMAALAATTFAACAASVGPTPDASAGPEAGARDARVALPSDASRGDAGTAGDAATARCSGPLAGWTETEALLGGDYERLVAADASGGRAPWVAAGGRLASRATTRLLRVEVVAGTPRVVEQVALAGTEAWEPLALARTDDAARFAMVARGADGEPWLALFARDGSTPQRTRIAALELVPRNRLEADVAFAGTDVVLVARRLGPDASVLERRSETLALRWQQPLSPAAYRLRPDGSRLRFAAQMYALTERGAELEPGAVAGWGMMGATRSAWVGEGNDGFRLERDEGASVSGASPATNFSTWGDFPAAESALGVFITLNVGFTPWVGWFHDDRLDWIAAGGAGGAGFPVVSADSIGVFYVGSEIPRPEQPLRYWGCRR